MNVVIQQTVPGDFGAIERILAEAELSGPWFTPAALAKGIDHNDGLYFVAESDGEVVGTIFASHDGWYHGYIYKLAVLAKCRRMGIGRQLVERVMEELSKLGVDWCCCGIEVGNQSSLALFESLGFDVGNDHHFAHKIISH